MSQKLHKLGLALGLAVAALALGCAEGVPPGRTMDAGAIWEKDAAAAKVALQRGELIEAARLFGLAVDHAEGFGPGDARLSASLTGLGNARGGLGKYEEAEAAFRRALAVDETRVGTNDVRIARDLCDIARVCGLTHRTTEADQLYVRAQTIVAWKFGPYDRAVGICLLKRANLYFNEARFGEAEPLYREALADIESERVRVHLAVGRPASRSVLPADVAEVAVAQNDLGMLYRQEKKLTEAEELLRKSLAGHEQVYGRKSSALISVLDNLAVASLDLRRFVEAEALLRRSLAIMDASAPRHPLRVRTEMLLDQSLTGQGKAAEKIPAPH